TSNSIVSRAGSSSALIGFSQARRRPYASATTVTTHREWSTPFTPPGQEALLRHCAGHGAAMTSTDRKAAARALLDFYREAGVNALLEETPTDRFASDQASAAPAARAERDRPPRRPPRRAPPPRPGRGPPPPPPRGPPPGGRPGGGGGAGGPDPPRRRGGGGARGRKSPRQPGGAARAPRAFGGLRVAAHRH